MYVLINVHVEERSNENTLFILFYRVTYKDIIKQNALKCGKYTPRCIVIIYKTQTKAKKKQKQCVKI